MSKDSADHVEFVEDSPHMTLLSGVVALAGLFSTCVEAFGLVHPSNAADKNQQRQLVRLGLQQARLLVWGSVLGITSPPASVTDRAIPLHPGNTYPDVEEPTFFTARDPRLDDPAIRTTIEDALSELVDRANFASREDMMARWGLRPPKKFLPYPEPALDAARLEAFRERHDLLREVAEQFAQIAPTRSSSIVHTSWQIGECHRFAAFVTATREKVDLLVDLLDVRDAVDRAVKMDLRTFGWHVAGIDRQRLVSDATKLHLLQAVCRDDDAYPQYLPAIETALEHIRREGREHAVKLPEKEFVALSVSAPASRNGSVSSSTTAGGAQHESFPSSQSGAAGHLRPPLASHQSHASSHTKKRPSLMKIFKSFGGRSRSSATNVNQGSQTQLYVPANMPPTPRSQSDSGPSSLPPNRPTSLPAASSTSAAASQQPAAHIAFDADPPTPGPSSVRVAANDDNEDLTPLAHVRSKSVGDIPQPADYLSAGQTTTFRTFDGAIDAISQRDFASSAAQQQQQQQQPPRSASEDQTAAAIVKVDSGREDNNDDGALLLLEKRRLMEKEAEEQRRREDALTAALAAGAVIRHDQYHGIARTETRDLHQGDY